MMWFAIWRGILAVLRWVLPIQPPRSVISPQEPCPACGNRDGTLRYVRVVAGSTVAVDHCPHCQSGSIKPLANGFHCNECGKDFGVAQFEGRVQRTCGVCQYAYYIMPISEHRSPAC